MHPVALLRQVRPGCLVFYMYHCHRYHADGDFEVFNENNKKKRDKKATTSSFFPDVIRLWLSFKGCQQELRHKQKGGELAAYQKNAVDELAAAYGVTILRLPPYHSELNPIELVWAQVKGHVARNNKSFKIGDLKQLFNEGLQLVTPERWSSCIDHVIKEETKTFIINVTDSDSDTDSSEINDYSIPHCESITGTLTIYNTKIFLCALYRPPNTDKHKFITHLKRTITTQPPSANIVVIGDTNINSRSSGGVAERYMNMMAECGLSCGISDYTRIEICNGKVTKSCIDHIYCRIYTGELHAAALGTTLADHRMIVLACLGLANIQAAPKRSVKYDPRILYSELDKIDWNVTSAMTSPNEIHSFITSNFSTSYKKASITYVPNAVCVSEEWVSKKVQNKIQFKDKMFIEWKKDKYNLILKQEYNKTRNSTNRLVESKRNKYYINKIKSLKNDIKGTWEIINKLTGRIKRSLDDIITAAFSKLNQSTIANNFAIEFETNVKSVISTCNQKLLHESSHESISDKSIYFKRATTNSVKKIIKNLNTFKSPGLDKIRPIDLKHLLDKIAVSIRDLINTSVSKGIYPDDLKKSIVRPIYKKGKFDCYENYRPISILSAVNKIVEKHVCGVITSFYENNNILNEHQHGFRANRSTSGLLSKFTTEICGHLNDKKHVAMVFVDYSKAFDTLRHSTLIKKLDNSGVRGPLLNWCKDYLKGRSYMVKVGSALSEQVAVTEGTAQGSVLGPTHFLSYVNDIKNLVKSCSLYQFADDTCLLAADRDLKVAEASLQQDFDTLCKWSHDVGLVLNSQKTKLMHIHSSHNTPSSSISLIAHDHSCLHGWKTACDCGLIENVAQQTYLGLVIDNRLNWGAHTELVANKLRMFLSKLKLIKKKFPYSVLTQMYLALADSVVSYGLTSYGRTFKTYLDKIYNLQLRIVKQIVPKNIKRKYKHNYDALFKYCNIIPIHTKFQFMFMVENYASIVNYPRLVSNRTRRAAQNYLHTPKTKNFYGQRTNTYLIPNLCNNLPRDIFHNLTNKNFKKVLRKHYTNTLPSLDNANKKQHPVASSAGPHAGPVPVERRQRNAAQINVSVCFDAMHGKHAMLASRLCPTRTLQFVMPNGEKDNG
ncbi:reverse transcriptase (RNA-dependent DNA polymerase) domain-containing protein [Phthorimaea operculella]|nr:reverse transcriptase (RNA-dependent DNA polymerase) domain-containing protein [Phthorimaea operculella]